MLEAVSRLIAEDVMKEFMIGLLVLVLAGAIAVAGFLLLPILLLLGIVLRVLIVLFLLLVVIWLVGKVTLLFIENTRHQ